MRRLSLFEKVLVVLLLFFDMTYCLAQKLPGDGAQVIPVMQNEINTYWPELLPKAYLAMEADQESGLKVKATLKTSRELGCGLGQFTIAYDARGNPRFDALAETKQLDPSLKNWNWKDCYNVQYQVRAMIFKLKATERNCSPLMANNREVKACVGSAYNGGFGGVTKRMRMCRMTAGCDPSYWFGNLERQCTQSTTKVAGYGESFCEINSKYPGRVEARQYKFKTIWPNDPILSEMTKKEKK